MIAPMQFRQVTKLVVEGWRHSCHSYALVNQQQLLHLARDPRLSLRHRDVKLYRPYWEAVDSGLPEESRARLSAIPTAAADDPADVVYRIGFPFRIHAGAGRVFVFATCETNRIDPEDFVGADEKPLTGLPAGVDVITPSEWSRSGLTSGGFPESRVHVIPHGVDPLFARDNARQRRAEVRSALGLDPQAFAFLNVGALTWNKGPGPLLAAFAVHRRRHPHSVLVLKGSEALYGHQLQAAIEEAARLRPEANDAALAGKIRYLKATMSVAQLSALYGACDAYVSSYRAEAFNLPVLEAMAAGLPVIVTDGGPTDDFCPAMLALRVRSRRTTSASGDFLEPDVDSLIEQMERVVTDPASSAAMASAASEWAINRYSWADVTAQLTALLLDETRNAHPA